MKRELQGKYVTITTVGEKAEAFIPSSLPPTPPIDWSPGLRDKFDRALLALGRLDSVSMLLPETSLFIYMYIRKEAVLSSQIEGTQSSLSDLLLFEFDQMPGVPLDDTQEVSNYVAALNHGLARMNDGFPLSLRLIMEIHEKLLSKGRGSDKLTGEFRRSQNWIGGSRPGNAFFVPPPPEDVLKCMGSLELYLHDQPEQTPTLIKAALAHVQFETIHPFLDGNGRLGRLLITLILCNESALKEPMLYLSLYFKTYRQQYYDLLNGVRNTGDWEAWLDFFAEAVLFTATQAVETVQSLLLLADKDRKEILKLGRISGSAHMLHHVMMERPIASPVWLRDKSGLSLTTVGACLDKMEELGIVKELTGQKRNRLYAYTNYISLMNQGTEL